MVTEMEHVKLGDNRLIKGSNVRRAFFVLAAILFGISLVSYIIGLLLPNDFIIPPQTLNTGTILMPSSYDDISMQTWLSQTVALFVFLVFPIAGGISALIGVAVRDHEAADPRVLVDAGKGVEVEVDLADSEQSARTVADHISADLKRPVGTESTKVFVIKNENGAIKDAAKYCDDLNKNKTKSDDRCIVI